MSLDLPLVRHGFPWATLQLPSAYRDRAIREIDVRDETVPRIATHWTHLRVEDHGEQYRIHVTTEPLPVPPGRRNVKGNCWLPDPKSNYVRADFAAYLGKLRWCEMPRVLDSIVREIDAEMLGLKHVKYRDIFSTDGFTWIEPGHRYDWSTSAYRDLSKDALVVRDAVAVVNTLLRAPQVSLCRATAHISFYD
jgi:hypothetical protein